MELFYNAKTVRLRSHHDKYLLADNDRQSVAQERHHSGSRRARWTVEYVNNTEGTHLVRLKSCFDKYLTATDEPFFMGVTGKKVVQKLPRRLDSSVEWEPIRDGMQVKLKTRYGNYLRANGGVPPWRNSITHDVPSRSHTQSWILWEIDVLAVYEEEKPKVVKKVEVEVEVEEEESEPEPFSADWIRSPHRQESSEYATSPVKNEGRLIYYNIVDDGNIDEGSGAIEIHFKGETLSALKEKLEEETGLDDILLCSRNPLNGKLNALRLALPPNHVKLHVFVVPSSSKVAGELGGPMSPSAA